MDNEGKPTVFGLSDFLFPLQLHSQVPDVFPSPFEVLPHPVAVQAAESLKARLLKLGDVGQLCEKGGKMFGVLVVKDGDGNTGYLSGFSGMLGQSFFYEGFVPPVFDPQLRSSLQTVGERQLKSLSNSIEALQLDETCQRDMRQLAEHDRKSTEQLAEIKSLHAKKKLERKLLRESADTELLAKLAKESRNDKYEFKSLKREHAENSAGLRSRAVEHQRQVDELIKKRKRLSRLLQIQLFEDYKLCDSDGNGRVINSFFENALPPSGAGDCAAVKLVQYANLRNLQSVALAEFWWGAPPVAGLRQHGRYYPSCRSRCRVLLPYMLNGLKLAIPRHEQAVDYADEYPYTLYEDDDILLIDKPTGLLSVPGKVLFDSVEIRLKARYPEVSAVMLLHRLDQATSGVMIAAKHPRAYKSLQHQFQNRTISKCYVAVLDGQIKDSRGSVELPLRLDYYDRPRQIVCAERGKPALTRYEVLSQDESTTKVVFYPHTGRTHQLRVHSAHPDGLNCAILGDELYGRPLERLYLHAHKLGFDHPLTGRRMNIVSEVPF